MDGLERLLTGAFKKRKVNGVTTNFKVHFIRYADDFVVTGNSRELLEREVAPLIARFLAVRGLELSKEKTTITHIGEGFDFLGQNVRKYGGKLLIKPSRENVKTFLAKVRGILKGQKTAKQLNVIRQLNPLVRGWANYHRHVVAKTTFQSVDKEIWQATWRWAKRRHPNKGSRWIKGKYFVSRNHRSWLFAAATGETPPKQTPAWTALFRAADLSIWRHIKVKADANPFDPLWETYFEERLTLKMKSSLQGRQKLRSLWLKQAGICPTCRQPLEERRGWHVHHVVPRARGGNNGWANLLMLHPNCHHQLHARRFNVVKPAPNSGL